MLEFVFLVFAGCLVGAITGLTPGLHVNTVCLIGLGLYGSLGLDAVGFSVFMVAMTVTQHFLDFIPAIFLGVPQEETALSIMPAHRLLLEGRGFEAVKLTAYGCLLGLVFGLLLLAPALYVIPTVYHQLRGFVVYLIMASALLLMWREKGWRGRLWASCVFVVSGLLGLLVLDSPGVSSTYVLFPVFAGLFGLSGIVNSLREKARIVPQLGYANVKIDKEVLGGGLFGAFGGMLVGLLPAMSPSQIGILMSEVFGTSVRGFLVSVSAINTSDAIYSLMSLYAIGNPRSGVSVIISRILELDLQTLMLFVGVFCLSAFIAAFIHIEVGRRAARYFRLVDYRVLSVCVLCLVVFLVYYFTGLFGVLIAFVSTVIGLLPIFSGVSRTHLMGVLMVPTILYFLGFG